MRMNLSLTGRVTLAILLLMGVVLSAHAVGLSDPVALPESYKPIAPTPPTGVTPLQPYITRKELKAEENEAPLNFEVALKMRNFADLQARIARGERISPQEMAAKYEPSAADYRKVTAWAASQGACRRACGRPPHGAVSQRKSQPDPESDEREFRPRFLPKQGIHPGDRCPDGSGMDVADASRR